MDCVWCYRDIELERDEHGDNWHWVHDNGERQCSPSDQWPIPEDEPTLATPEETW